MQMLYDNPDVNLTGQVRHGAEGQSEPAKDKLGEELPTPCLDWPVTVSPRYNDSF